MLRRDPPLVVTPPGTAARVSESLSSGRGTAVDDGPLAPPALPPALLLPAERRLPVPEFRVSGTVRAPPPAERVDFLPEV